MGTARQVVLVCSVLGGLKDRLWMLQYALKLCISGIKHGRL
jgi:hypothetical protein